MLPHPPQNPSNGDKLGPCTPVPIWSRAALRKLALLTFVTAGASVGRVALAGPVALQSPVAHAMHAVAHCRQKRGMFHDWTVIFLGSFH